MTSPDSTTHNIVTSPEALAMMDEKRSIVIKDVLTEADKIRLNVINDWLDEYFQQFEPVRTEEEIKQEFQLGLARIADELNALSEEERTVRLAESRKQWAKIVTRRNNKQ